MRWHDTKHASKILGPETRSSRVGIRSPGCQQPVDNPERAGTPCHGDCGTAPRRAEPRPPRGNRGRARGRRGTRQGRSGLVFPAARNGPNGIPLFRREWDLARPVALVEQMQRHRQFVRPLTDVHRPPHRDTSGTRPGDRTFGDNRGLTCEPACPIRGEPPPRWDGNSEHARAGQDRGAAAMVASIGAISSPSQGASYYERDGYYAKDDAAHREASAWAGRGAAALGLAGPVDPATFQEILEGRVPGRPAPGQARQGWGDPPPPRPRRDDVGAQVGVADGDDRRRRADRRRARQGGEDHPQLDREERDPHTDAGPRTESGAWPVRPASMIFAGDQKTVVATFRHDTSRNLDPQLHTHCVIANMVQGGDGKWRTMVNDGLYRQQRAVSAIYRAELAEGIARLGYEHRAHPRRRPLRDRGHPARDYRGLLHPPGRDRGGDEGARLSTARPTTRGSRTAPR